EQEPPKPSTRLADSKDRLPTISAQRKLQPTQLKKLVRGDLDWIVMRALEKDRNRRYKTANALETDLRRHLSEWWRAATLKRGGGQQLIPLETNEAETRYFLEPAEESSPDKLYNNPAQSS